MNTEQVVYLTDTHPLIWYFLDSPKLSAPANNAFTAVDQGKASLLIPAIVVAELVFVVEKGRVQADIDYLLERIRWAPNFKVIPLELEALLLFRQQTAIEEIHDRMVVVEALRHNATLITKDKAIHKSGIVEVIW